MTKIVLAGNAITAEILWGYLADDAQYDIVASTVDDAYADKDGVPGIETVPLSKLPNIHPPSTCRILMAMGYNNVNQNRESFFVRLLEMGYGFETYVHPDAKIYTSHPLGEGSIVLPAAVIEPNAKVGKNTMIWCNVTLAHHSSVADHCWIAAGSVISGQARVASNVFVGVNATVTNAITVGEKCIIGGGALITKNTKPSTVHLARSAEELRFTSDDYDKYFGI